MKPIVVIARLRFTQTRCWLGGVWLALLGGLWAGTQAWAQTALSEQCLYPVPQWDAAYWQKEAATATNKGLLWRLEKNGRTSWLLGTLHVNQPQTTLLGPRITQALLRSDVLAVEFNLFDPTLGQSLRESIAEPLPALSETTIQAVQEVLAKACHPQAGDLSAIGKNMLVPSTITSHAKSFGFFADYGVDVFLLGMAQGMKKPVHSLETVQMQAQAIRSMTPTSDFETFVQNTLQSMGQGDIARLFERMHHIWVHADYSTLADYARWCQCQDDEKSQMQFKRINDDRNPGLAKGIAQLHDQGQQVFAAVGMLHTTGPQAVPRLLQQMGFVVTPLTPNQP